MINKKDFLAYRLDFALRVLKPLFKYVGEYVTISDEAVLDGKLPTNRGILIDLYYEKGQDTGIISQDYYEYALISFPGQGENVVGVHELTEDGEAKQKAVTSMLIDLFDRINIDTPSNFDEINEYVFDDICETADDDLWHDGDVAIAFRRWIELKTIL